MTAEEMETVIDQAETELNECFQILMDIKRGKLQDADLFLQFQPKLADCLYDLMKQYKKVIAEEKETITKKKHMDIDVFTNQMREYAAWKEAIKKVMETGKAIGDGFAWFFYRNSPEELEKHYEHEDNGLFVAGIGGRGEIEFIREKQNIEGCFVLYHSITNMLRVGDFSLCSVDGYVIGVGELKSEYVDSHLNVTAYVTSKIEIHNQNNEEDGSVTKPNINPSPERLERQLKSQEQLLTKEKGENQKADQWISYQYHLITQAMNSPSFSSISDDNSMVVVAVKEEGSLWQVLTNESEPENDNTEEFLQMVKKTIIDESSFNAIHYQPVDLGMLPFRKPIIWWELEDNVIRGILFHKITVLTIYNVAHFYEKLISHGFTVRKENGYKITQKSSKGLAELESPEMLLDLVTHDFISNDEIVHFIEMGLKEAVGAQKESVKMKLRLHQNPFGKSQEETAGQGDS